MNLTESLLNTVLGNDTVGALSKTSGAKKTQVESLIGAALPLMLESMQNNVRSSKGEQALTQALNDHAGADAADVASFLSGVDAKDSAKILQHLFGENTNKTVTALSKKTGIQKSQTMSILLQLAPLLLSFLGQQNQGNSGGIGSILGSLLGDSDSGTSGSLIGSLLGSDTSDAAGSLIGSLLGGGSGGSNSSLGGALLGSLLGSNSGGSSHSNSSVAGTLLSALLSDDNGNDDDNDGGDLLGSLLGGSSGGNSGGGDLLGSLLGGNSNSLGGSLLTGLFGDDSQKSAPKKKSSSGAKKTSTAKKSTAKKTTKETFYDFAGDPMRARICFFVFASSKSPESALDKYESMSPIGCVSRIRRSTSIVSSKTSFRIVSRSSNRSSESRRSEICVASAGWKGTICLSDWMHWRTVIGFSSFRIARNAFRTEAVLLPLSQRALVASSITPRLR